MENKNLSIFQKTYLTVSPATARYFRKVWLEQTKLSERTFRHRLVHPELFDVLLFCHVCELNLSETLKPFCEQFKNIPAFNKNLQLTIEP